MNHAERQSEATGRPVVVDGEPVTGRLPARYLPFVAVGLLAVAVLCTYGAVRGFPVPRVHDEFAYLLTGDTFTKGRLANPTHPHWLHFESFHVFHEPTYQAKYPPGQGAFLALGELTFGHPAWGVWIGLALALGALAWMLAAAVPLPWALLGAVLWLVNGRVFLKWGQSYWGGGVALLGGALFLGGLLRCWKRPRIGSASAAAVGLVLLANTRPAEGAALALLCLPLWLRAALRPAAVPLGERRVAHVLGPLAVGLVVLALWTLLYDHAVTGDALRLPYVHWNEYVSPLAAVREYVGSDPGTGTMRAMRIVRFYFGEVLVWTLPLLLWRPSRRTLGAAAVVLVLGIGSWATTRAWPHYLAPVAPLAALLVVEALRRVAALGAWGRWIGTGLVVAHASVGALIVARDPVSNAPQHWSKRRLAIAEELEARGGRHLVFVRYGEGHSQHAEWVYNGADLDGSSVLWARELEAEANAALAQHFSGRRVWLVEPDAEVVEPVPWEPRAR